MSYIGNVPTTAAFPFDQFSGTGSQVAFTLSQAPASTTSIAVTVSGVTQNPNTYSVSGTTLTFTGAPPSGTNNIGVLFLGLPTLVGVPSTATVGLTQLSATGTPSATNFHRGDNTWAVPTVDALTTASGSAPSYSARAWVNFNGSGTIAIRASGNVSSITDGGVGIYVVNFTTAMPDVNYICVTDGYDIASGATAIKTQAYANTSTFPATISSQPVLATNAAGSAFTDLDRMFVAIFR